MERVKSHAYMSLADLNIQPWRSLQPYAHDGSFYRRSEP